MKEALLSITDIIEESAAANDVAIIDMGLNNPCAWRCGCGLIEEIILGMGTVSIGDAPMKDHRLPTLNLNLDNPEAIDMPLTREMEEGCYYDFEALGFSVGLFQTMPEEPEIPSKSKFLVVTRATGLVASILRSFFDTLETIKESRQTYGPKKLLWTWSSAVLPGLYGDKDLYEKKRTFLKEHGTVIGLYVKDVSDDDTRVGMSHFSSRGRIQIQNYSTANTFVVDSLDYDACAVSLGL